MLIHIGLQKCATTTLQDHFFSNEAMFLFFSQKGKVQQQRSKLFERLYLELCSGNVTDVAEKLAQNITQMSSEDSRFAVMSEEAFTQGKFAPENIEDNLQKLFPKAKILILYRDELEMIKSLYVMDPFNKDLDKPKYLLFEEWLKDVFFLGLSHCPESFNVSKIVKKYNLVFGAENVFVSKLEDFFLDEETQKRFSSFCQLDYKLVGQALNHARKQRSNGSHTHIMRHILKNDYFIIKSYIDLFPRLKKSIKNIIKLFVMRKNFYASDEARLLIKDYYSDEYK